VRVEVIDLRFQGVIKAIASFLVFAPEGPVLVEAGPATTVPELVKELAERGVRPEDVKHVLVSHIHLDHAGAAGWWARQGAKIYVHDQGAPHLIDPSKLLASAGRIYGDMMDTLWGETLPCPPEAVVPLAGDGTIQVAGLEVETLDTPGHARHHLAFGMGNVLFTGDVAGVRLPDLEFISLPAPPPEFDREAWQKSLDKLRKKPWERYYLTHFGAVDEPRRHLQRFDHLLDEATEFIGSRVNKPRDEVVKEYYAWNERRGDLPEEIFERYEKANPLFMSVDGILRYWKKR